MNGAALAERLVQRGLDPCEGPAKRSLFDLVLETFARHATRFRAPAHVWWVPGRLEVFGKHTDYAGGRSLVCAVPRGLAIAASPRLDGQVHIVDARRGESVMLQPQGDVSFTGWRHYAETVARRLARNFPGAPLGVDVVFASDLPRASGMSSSSALVVGLAAALGRVGGIDATPGWHANIRSTLDAAAYYACIENGRTFGTLVGDAGVGTHGGSEDHAAIVSSTAGALAAYAFVPMRHIESVEMPEEWRFVIAVSGVASEKTGAAQQSYNRLARGADVLLQLWNGGGANASSLAMAIQSTPSAGVRLRELVRGADAGGWPAAALEKRLAHFIDEDARVPVALDAFRRRSAETLARLSQASQTDAEMLLGNQVPETIALARSARELGAFAACSFGAGFGGSVWALVERDAAEMLAARWQPGAFVAKPAPALTPLQTVNASCELD